MQTIGERIRALLAERGWKQKDLAARSGVGEAVISRFVTGKREDISAHDLAAIARALDASLSWLYDGSGPRRLSGLQGGEPELNAFEWPPDTPEATRIAVQREVLMEREAHRQALVPYWLGRLQTLLAERRR